ncbi:hypothetical protein [Erythrobacter sp. MTPC3]|uniref:hypothetical protein n=1 Tax=Erythrobacter sp. MTPC3 TaxID=3056564 RepID=UPI0036F24403
MSQQLALSSIFSVLALASLCLAVGNGQITGPRSDGPVIVSQPFSAQSSLPPVLAD